MAARDIMRWKRDFLDAPKVWATITADGDIANLYESRAAARLEVEWAKGRGRLFRVTAEAMTVHTLKLSRDRWGPSSEEKPR